MSTATLQIEKIKTLVPQLRFPEFEGEWELEKFGKIATNKSGKFNPIKENSFTKCIELEHLGTETGQLLGFIDGSNSGSIKNKFNEGDVLFGKLRPYLKKYLQAPFEGICSSEIWVLKGVKITNSFLYQIVQTNKFIDLANQSSGSKMPRADWNVVENCVFTFPTHPEQQKIASFLSAVDEKIQQLSRKKVLLEQYKKGVMQQLFSGKLRFKDENGKDYADWEEKKLGDLVTLMQSGISRMLSDTDIGLPIIRSNNLQNGRIDITDIKYWFEIDNQGANLENYVLSEGDLLVNFINSIAQIGKVAMFSDLMKRKTIFTTNLLRLRFNEKVTSYFMINYFHLKKYEDFIQSITKPAVNQASFTTKDFRTFIINLPSLPEQQKIANFLSSIDAKIESTSQQLNQTQNFKKGLLQQMFV